MAGVLPVFFQIMVDGGKPIDHGGACWAKAEYDSNWDRPYSTNYKAVSWCVVPTDEFTYTLRCSPTEPDVDRSNKGIVTFDYRTSCHELLQSNGAVSNYKLSRDWLLPDLIRVPLNPQKNGPLAKHMFPKDSKRTDGCYEDQTLCTLDVYTLKYVFAKGVCTLLLRVSCNRECSNGQYADGYTTINQASNENTNLLIDSPGTDLVPLSQETGLYNQTVVCKACEPGTWNTCLITDTCKWTVPTILNPRKLGDQIHAFFPPPGTPLSPWCASKQRGVTSWCGPAVKACYPCATAKQSMVHFSESPSKRVDLVDDLDIFCAGGDAPPRNCKNSNFQHSRDYSRCVCKDGFYEQAGDCVACPKGSWCLEGVKTPCPLHKYQDLEKATECKSCAVERDGELVYSGCTGNRQRRWCEPGTSEPACVPCTRCRKAYLTRNTDERNPEVDCYKNY